MKLTLLTLSFTLCMTLVLAECQADGVTYPENREYAAPPG